MPEKFAFVKFSWNRGTVHADKCPTSTLASLVNFACHQFLAGSGFAKNEDRGIRRGDKVNLLNHRTQGVTPPDEIPETVFGHPLQLERAFSFGPRCEAGRLCIGCVVGWHKWSPAETVTVRKALPTCREGVCRKSRIPSVR
ncbi:hypothetical protein NITMOv2_1668 [Nitrospira moscoviensis]|uniref:Uncharacterized protein n=1 Tax=Nitrospira moscoviensis TaxID=42253 RepID=A0A0K2GAW7_NITMO|nr:hypothetical protein NITMOv2_1668 [Nitrospira moscoviensis]